MIAAQQEIISRILKSVELHALGDGELVAACVHATAAALIEATGISRKQVAAALQRRVIGYHAYAEASEAGS